MRDIWVLSDTAIEQAREEMLSLQARAEKAEMALEDTRATLRGEAEAIRLRAEKAEYALEVAHRQAAHELHNAQVAKEKQRIAEEQLAVVESEKCTLRNQLHSATIEIDTAKEVARQTDAQLADLKVAATEAERKAAEADKKVVEAERKVIEAERRASEAEKKATEAVEDFRKSGAFNKELAESTMFAYESGFQDCKEKIQKFYDLEGIEELEPDEFPEDDDPAPGDP